MIDAGQRDEPSVGKKIEERLARSGEIVFADDDQCRTRDASEFVWREGRTFSFEDGCQSQEVVSGLEGVLHEESSDVARRGVIGVFSIWTRLSLQSGHDGEMRRGVGWFEDISAYSGKHQTVHSVRVSHGESKNRHCAEGESDEITGRFRQDVEDASSEIVVSVGLVRFGCVPVTEQVHTDHRCTGIAKQIDETTGLPRGFEGTSPSVDEDDRMLCIGRDRT